MFNRTRLILIALCALVALNSFSATAFYFRPVARLFALRLVGADLKDARLGGRSLAWADLRGADLSGAILDGADLRGADLTGVVGLTRDQLAAALVDAGTALPYGLRPEDVFSGASRSYDITQTVIDLKFVPYKVAISHDGSVVAVVGERQEVKLWRITEQDEGVEELTPLTGLGGHGRSVCFHPSDVRVVAAGSDDGMVRLWRVGDPVAFKLMGPPVEGYVFNLKFERGGGMLGFASRDEASGRKTVSGRSVEIARGVSSNVFLGITPEHLGPGKLIVDFNMERMEITAAAAPQNGAGQEGAPAEEGSRWRVRSAEGEVTGGAYSGDGRFLALGSKRGGDGGQTVGLVSIWNAEENRRLDGPPPAPDSFAVSFDFSSDGALLACGWSDGSISLWDVEKAQRVLDFGAHAGEISSLAFALDWKTLASVGSDGTLRLWRLAER